MIAAVVLILAACGAESHPAPDGELVGTLLGAFSAKKNEVRTIELRGRRPAFLPGVSGSFTSFTVSGGFAFLIDIDLKVTIVSLPDLSVHGTLRLGYGVVNQVCVVSPDLAYAAAGPSEEVTVFSPTTLELFEPVSLLPVTGSQEPAHLRGCAFAAGRIYFSLSGGPGSSIIALDVGSGSWVDAEPDQPGIQGIAVGGLATTPPGLFVDGAEQDGYVMSSDGLVAFDLGSSWSPSTVVPWASFGGEPSSFSIVEDLAVVTVGMVAGRPDVERVQWYDRESGSLLGQVDETDALPITGLAAATAQGDVLVRLSLPEFASAVQVLEARTGQPLWPRPAAVPLELGTVFGLVPPEGGLSGPPR